jgi:hypothetical protein
LGKSVCAQVGLVTKITAAAKTDARHVLRTMTRS